MPEFDGRIITVPFSFKEIDDEGLISYVADPERCARVARARRANTRGCGDSGVRAKRVALVFSAYPTKHARIGNAVGLDTPASAVALLRAMRDAGYAIGDVPGVDAQDGDALIHALIERGGQDPDWLTDGQLSGQSDPVACQGLSRLVRHAAAELTDAVVAHWGPPPGELFVDRSRGSRRRDRHRRAAGRQRGADGPAAAGLRREPGRHLPRPGSAAQPPLPGRLPLDRTHVFRRGRGRAPRQARQPGVAARQDARHVRGVRRRRRAGQPAADLPVPGQRPGRAPRPSAARTPRWSTTSFRRWPAPKPTATSQRLEQLLDEHATIAALDPGKLPAIRQQIWTLMRAAKMDHDLGLDERPEDDSFDDMLLHVDGWLCEIKDVQIRDGLHILGEKPDGRGELDLVLAILRARQLFGGEPDRAGAAPGAGPRRGRQRRPRGRRRRRGPAPASWSRRCRRPAGTPRPSALSPTTPTSRDILRFAATEVVPRLAETAAGDRRRSCGRSTAASSPSGPSGSPLRGLVNVLPTGRNFYSVDPEGGAVQAGVGNRCGDGRFAAGPLPRRLRPTGRNRSGCRCGARAAMRTAGDDIAEVLALLGVRPIWDDASRRVVEPRADPAGRTRQAAHRRDRAHLRASSATRSRTWSRCSTTRCSSSRTSTSQPTDNYVRAHAQADLAEHGDQRRATTRIFGSKPGTYGAGLLQLIDSRNWRDDADLAEVYTAWGGFAYGRGLDGAPAADDMNAAIPADRGGRQEHRHPRARHRRLRRLLPVPRRHGRHRPGADRAGTRPRTSATTPGPTPCAPARCRRRPPVSSGPASSTRAGSRRCGGTATRAPSRWPPPSTTCSATTPPPGVMADWMYERLARGVRARRREPQVHGRSRTRGRCTAWPSDCWKPQAGACGRSRKPGHPRRAARGAAGDRRRTRRLTRYV